MALHIINNKLTTSLNVPLFKYLCYNAIKKLSYNNIPPSTPFTQNKKETEFENISKSKTILGKVITKFNAPIAYAFAYGSGVFKQKGYENEKKKPLVDYVFAVENPLEWHKINFKQFQNHYSGLGKLSHNSKILSIIQENYGAKIYYNTFVEIENM
eukprot:jgi/Orpsp1_1/1190336/evm.model.d7180000078349.1